MWIWDLTHARLVTVTRTGQMGTAALDFLCVQYHNTLVLRYELESCSSRFLLKRTLPFSLVLCTYTHPYIYTEYSVHGAITILLLLVYAMYILLYVLCHMVLGIGWFSSSALILTPTPILDLRMDWSQYSVLKGKTKLPRHRTHMIPWYGCSRYALILFHIMRHTPRCHSLIKRR